MTTTNLSRSPLPLPLLLLVGGRALAGAGAWVAPDLTWRAAGLGPLPDRGSATVVSRLFGVRDLALAGAAAQPHPDVRRAALLAGIAIDSIDAVSGFLGVRGGAPRGALLGVSAGALLLAGLGIASVRGTATT